MVALRASEAHGQPWPVSARGGEGESAAVLTTSYVPPQGQHAHTEGVCREGVVPGPTRATRCG